jgi:hypothetical protein
MYVRTYVCMYVCMYACMYVNTTFHRGKVHMYMYATKKSKNKKRERSPLIWKSIEFIFCCFCFVNRLCTKMSKNMFQNGSKKKIARAPPSKKSVIFFFVNRHVWLCKMYVCMYVCMFVCMYSQSCNAKKVPRSAYMSVCFYAYSTYIAYTASALTRLYTSRGIWGRRHEAAAS